MSKILLIFSLMFTNGLGAEQGEQKSLSLQFQNQFEEFLKSDKKVTQSFLDMLSNFFVLEKKSIEDSLQFYKQGSMPFKSASLLRYFVSNKHEDTFIYPDMVIDDEIQVFRQNEDLIKRLLSEMSPEQFDIFKSRYIDFALSQSSTLAELKIYIEKELVFPKTDKVIDPVSMQLLYLETGGNKRAFELLSMLKDRSDLCRGFFTHK